MGWVEQLNHSVLSSLGRGDQTLPGLEGAPAFSSATLRILASMPSRTIGELSPLPLCWPSPQLGSVNPESVLGSQLSCCWSLKLSIALGYYWILNITTCHSGGK